MNFAVLRELHDARVRVLVVAVRDEDVAAGGDGDVRGLVEGVGPLAGDARLAERQQQLSARAELEDLVALPVSSRARRSATRSPPRSTWMPCGKMNMPAREARGEAAGRVEHEHGGQARAGAGVRAAPLATQMDLPSRAISTALVAPHVRPSGIFAQPSTVRYGLGSVLGACASTGLDENATAATAATNIACFTCRIVDPPEEKMEVSAAAILRPPGPFQAAWRPDYLPGVSSTISRTVSFLASIRGPSRWKRGPAPWMRIRAVDIDTAV